jgi:hypothetical protein
MILLLLSPIVPLSAQNILFNPHGQYEHESVFNKDKIISRDIEINKEKILSKIKTEKEFYDLYFDIKIINKKSEKKSFNVVNDEVLKAFFNKPIINEEKLIRQQWENVFGFDVWYPYYKAKEIEGLVKKKLTIRIFKFKGEPLFELNRTLYVFKSTF